MDYKKVMRVLYYIIIGGISISFLTNFIIRKYQMPLLLTCIFLGAASIVFTLDGFYRHTESFKKKYYYVIEDKEDEDYLRY